MTPRATGFSFHVVARDGRARQALFRTPHGDVVTPTFMPVGTQGSVKTLAPGEVAATGAQIVLGNTYHLMLRPGAETIGRLGGLHAFTRWPHATLTDSGGFQAYSLGALGGMADDGVRGARLEQRASRAAGGRGLVGVSEEGFAFKSHLDGSTHMLTPEHAVRVQAKIGADIQMQLDVCPPGQSSRDVVQAAVARTTRWARRSLATPRPESQALFGIVQGGCFVDLRRAHAEELGGLPFDGLALGGFSVGEPIERMHETLLDVSEALDAERPRYLMGVGTPRDLVVAIGAGLDMFDCVLPTRNARNGQALTRFGRVVVKQARYREDPRPIDERCACACCTGGYSRAYLRHLYLAREMLSLRLLSVHNLHWYGELMGAARAAIAERRFAAWAREVVAEMASGDAIASDLDDPAPSTR
ncbi:MAG: tRNA guanosine(34) transglycosylase Tgt [Myxococcota bacterium]|nr:tRNA guanosine(34) transglycosylase Tgt [Myxococcota bacterium]